MHLTIWSILAIEDESDSESNWQVQVVSILSWKFSLSLRLYSRLGCSYLFPFKNAFFFTLPRGLATSYINPGTHAFAFYCCVTKSNSPFPLEKTVDLLIFRCPLLSGIVYPSRPKSVFTRFIDLTTSSIESWVLPSHHYILTALESRYPLNWHRWRILADFHHRSIMHTLVGRSLSFFRTLAALCEWVIYCRELHLSHDSCLFHFIKFLNLHTYLLERREAFAVSGSSLSPPKCTFFRGAAFCIFLKSVVYSDSCR